MPTRVLLASDLHLCDMDAYGIPSEVRMQKFADDIKSEYEKEPFSALLLLGDYSLDHWKWGTKGSWLERGVSNTKAFAEKYLSQIQSLPIEIRMIAGNHEQYGEENWERLTGGFKRQDTFVCGDYLFLLLDTYAAQLDPTEHSDGYYSGIPDTGFICETIASHPGKKVILCAHYLDLNIEAENGHTDFLKMIASKQFVCAFAGHTHNSDIWTWEKYETFKEIFTGNYWKNESTPYEPMWGFREVLLFEDRIESNYITPEAHVFRDGKPYCYPYGKQDPITISLISDLA